LTTATEKRTGLDLPFAVIGHRGAAGLEPENTLRSFRRAFDLGVPAVELDVYAIEGSLVVIHDDRLERTTNGRGLVQTTPLATLRALDAGKGERIPLLEEVFAITPPGVAVNVELKGRGTAPLAAALLHSYPQVDVLISSFSAGELEAFRALDRDTKVGALFHRVAPRMLEKATALGAWSINLSNEIATRERIASVRQAGFRCFVYTINDPARARELEAAGANGIFTDRPDLMLPWGG
jgi:glycerophosphoryl diester phosphodiesterase